MREELMKNSDGNNNAFIEIKKCRVCNSQNLSSILDLGSHPLANSLRENIEIKEIKVPLELKLCSNCKVAQLGHTVDPKVMFSNYLWVTGTSNTTTKHAEDFFKYSKENIKSIPNKVLEIASNDGTFLKPFKSAGSIVYGIDPAKNIAHLANAENLTTFVDFFSANSYDRYNEKIGKVDFIFARNVLAHVPNPMGFIRGMNRFMKEDSIGAVEFHYSKIIIDELHYDSIYHEHYFYYSINNIKNMLTQNELHIFDAKESPINKGNVIIYFSKKKLNYTESLDRYLLDENITDISSLWKNFAILANNHRAKFIDCLSSYDRITGFGSSARSSTLLNFANINNSKIRIIVDNNQLKQNKYTSGSDIQIVSPNNIDWQNEKIILVLAWNFFDEIKQFLLDNKFKGTLIKPFPEVETFLI